MKGRRAVEVVPDESLEARIAELGVWKKELYASNKEHKEKTQHLRDIIDSAENIIKAEVMELGHSVCVGDIKVEFVPTVVIKLRKEKKND